MTIVKILSKLFQSLLLASALTLTACGGGGGGKKQENLPPADTTPNAITLAASTNVEPGTVVTSAPVTITGINTAAPVSIVGGEYSISGGAFTANPGSITNGQTLTVRITAPDKTNTPKEAVVTVGGVSAKFTVTTVADVTPDAFTFAPKSDAQLNAEYTSDAITVTGFDVAVPVSIVGGLYSINGGAFTAAAGTVAPGQTITVKTTAAAKTETAQNAVVTIGGVNGTFTVTTIQDSFAPVAEFKFPTPYTMSEAMSVKVRGTATDDNSITNVKVVVRSYKLEAPTVTLSSTEINATPKAEANGVKDFSSWTVDVPLTALAENEIKVVATDARNNSIAVDAANKVVIRQANVSSAFPDEVNEFENINVSAFDAGRNRILASDWQKVVAVDLSTGQRTTFIEHQSLCNSELRGLIVNAEDSQFYGLCEGYKLLEFNLLNAAFVQQNVLDQGVAYSASLDKANGRTRLVLVEWVYAFNAAGGGVFAFSLNSKKFSIISDASEEPLIKGSNTNGGVIADGDNYWITSGGQHSDATLRKVIKVNAITGAREIFADNDTGSGEFFSALLPNGDTASLAGIVKDEKNNQLIVMENIASRLLAVDLITRERSLFKDLSYIGTPNARAGTGDLDLSEDNEFLLVTDGVRNALVIVDIETKEKLILSKSKNDFQ